MLELSGTNGAHVGYTAGGAIRLSASRVFLIYLQLPRGDHHHTRVIVREVMVLFRRRITEVMVRYKIHEARILIS